MKKITLIIPLFLLFMGAGCSTNYFDPAATPTNSLSTTATTPAASVATATATLTLKNGRTLSLTHPDDYSLSVAAEGYKRLRFMAKSPDNRLFVGEMFNANDSQQGKIYVFDDFDLQTKKFTSVHTYLSNLRNPHSLTFYTDANNTTWLYIALTDKLIRYAYTPGDNAPTTKPETITTFPAYGQSVKQGGWHLTRTIVIHNDKLYISVGSSCNSCEEKESEPNRASILVMNPDGSDSRVFATGLRNAVGLTFVGNALLATNNNADHLGDDRPADTVYEVLEGKNYGWPYCYEFNKKIEADTSKKWTKNFDCGTAPLADIELPPHSAPLGIAYFDKQLLIALHGSGNKKLQTGYAVVSAGQNGTVSPFLTGFQQGTAVTGRPAGILVNDEKSFFVTDDFNGALYYIEKK